MQVLSKHNLRARSKSTFVTATAWAKRLCWRRAFARLRQTHEWILGTLRKNEPLLLLIYRILILSANQ